MSEALFSDRWHRVRALRPRLAPNVEVRRHVYRGVVCWVLHRAGTRHWHRLDRASHALVERFDGALSVDALWQQALDERDTEAPTQDQLIALLAMLHEADLLEVDRALDVERMFARREQATASDRRSRYLNPFFLRFAVADPDRWLARASGIGEWLFCRGAWRLWLLLSSSALLVLGLSVEQLVADIGDLGSLSTRHALLLALIWPPLKALHEAAHALAVKSRGGEVHEVGLAFMVLLPLPYVDASASAAFVRRRDRLLVDAAGLLAELAVASVAVLIWSVTRGEVHDFALLVMLTAGVSTLLFNGNPLLKFDGYYLLSDWLEIPNLAARSRRAWVARLRALVTGKAEPDDGSIDRAAHRWLLGYGVASGVYRVGLMLVIAWMLSARWPVAGVLLGAWALYVALLKPLAAAFKTVLRDPAWRSARARGLAFGAPATLVLVLMTVPFPHATVADGVIWLPDEAVVRVAVDCEVTHVHTTTGSDVAAGTPLFDCDAPDIDASVIELQAELDRLSIERAGLGLTSPVEQQRLERRARAASEAFEQARERQQGRFVAAASAGRFDAADTVALAGRHLAAGQIAGYLLSSNAQRIRVALPEAIGARIGGEEDTVELRVSLPGGGWLTVPSRILRRPLEASLELSSAALTDAGGGALVADPSGDGRTVLEPAFELELALPPTLADRAIGERVEVRFDHGAAPIAGRLIADLRRALAARLAT